MDFTSSEEILDILFDEDDPLLKDVDYYLDGNISENLDELKNNVFQINNHTDDFWNAFLKEVEKENSGNERKYSCDYLDTDSTSVYSNSLSPQSVSSSSSSAENVETSVVIDSMEFSDYSTIPKLSHTNHHTYANMSTEVTLPTNIDIGADVVVVTSENVVCEDSFSSVNNPLEEEVFEVPKKKSPCKRTLEDDSVFQSVPQILKLSDEEKKLLKKEGLHIPTNVPLTKAEEKELKRIRRKIRNKQSAQESRKRKKDYVDGLETRVKICSSENMRLQKKIQTMEKEQKGLLEQIKHLQAVISNSTGKSVQSNTCLMVLFLSLALILFPSFMPSSMESKDLVPRKNQPSGRVLLSASDNSDPGSFHDSINNENISKSHIKQIPELSSESIEAAYSKMFPDFRAMPPVKMEKYVSSDYISEPIDMHSNSSKRLKQNDSTYAEINAEKNSKKDILLFNK